jgi:ABC-2 type transport system permease protein
MSPGLKRELTVLWGFVERNFALAKRYIGWEVVFLTFNAVNAITIGLIGVATGDPNLVLFLVIGALMWGFLSLLFDELAFSIVWERWEGTLEYTMMAPIRRSTHMLGTCLWGILYGLLRATVVIFLLLLFFNLSLPGANVLGAFAVMLASSVAFIGLGLLAAVLPMLSPERGAQAADILQAVILLFSGVYYRLEALPEWMQAASSVSPATYTLRAVRAALLEGAGWDRILPDLVTVLLIGAVLVPVGAITFAITERWAKKTGKLKRSG